ncbi:MULTISPECIES: ATP-binding response regulator [unclassified Mesorhizobium]|uniref:ATP-binding response regulator n=1 Tax=unclassified Mesorhizobium TaxID=325217 RepID=UPI000467B4F0|nr:MULTISPECIES: ATP-binding protein [unclassified Mesorhizobium]
MASPLPSDVAAILDSLDSVATGIAVWDADHRLSYANRPFRHAFYLDGQREDTEGEEGLTYLAALLMAARSNEWVLPMAADHWAAAQLVDFGSDKRSHQALADGRTIEIVQKPTPSGGMVMTLNDITSMKRSEHALREAKELAETADDGKSRFLRAANHDLRQPLATLRILIYNCIGEVDHSHRQDMLHTMDIAVSIMEDLLGALLQIGQLDAGQIRPRVATFQLFQIFQRLDIQFQHVASQKGLHLRFVDSRNAVVSDKALLERILSNLVANAIRYTEVGKVLVGCRRVGKNLRIEVWDTGCGIEAENLPRIFDEFFQVGASKRAKKAGLGLGLNIVTRLCGLLGHELNVRSTPGKGSVFSISLPLGNIWHSDIGEPEISERIGGEFMGISVLLVEDDDTLRQATRDLLERWGILVHTASSTEDARRLIEDESIRPRLIIADYSLRGEHGTTVIATIRDSLMEPVPGVVVTADTDPQVIGTIKEAGFPVLIKPVSPPRLRVLMHKLLFEPEQPASRDR